MYIYEKSNYVTLYNSALTVTMYYREPRNYRVKDHLHVKPVFLIIVINEVR